MPLPDERPRQSVANLIGKFETQTKRLSISASSPSRSSSVVSHITGDSSKEEVKERREWPPRSAVESSPKQPPIVSALYSRHPPPPLVTSSLSNPPTVGGDNKKQSASGKDIGEAEVPLTAKALNDSQWQVKGEPNSFLENWRKDLPTPSAQDAIEPPSVPDTAKPDLDLAPGDASALTPTLATTKKLATPSAPRTPIALSKSTSTRTSAPSKPVTSTPARTPVKSVLRSPSSRQSLATPVAQPLKPQHTGQSVASNATTKRPVTKPPPVPASAKTPARPDAAPRSKTPTSSRPKTPSSGLFAPTAASLAKSRNAAPPVPTPVKKAHLSSNSLDRLSKPTAASQARMAAAAPSTSRPAAAAPRTPIAKSKVAPASKPQKDGAFPRVGTAATVAASVAAIGLAVAATEGHFEITEQVKVEEVIENNEKTPSAEGSNLEVEAEAVDNVPEEVETVVNDEVQGEDEDPSAEDHDGTSKSSEPEPALETEVEKVESTEEYSADQHNRDDLEDIVNLLESVSITKPHPDTTADIPDEILEIPDEEEK